DMSRGRPARSLHLARRLRLNAQCWRTIPPGGRRDGDEGVGPRGRGRPAPLTGRWGVRRDLAGSLRADRGEVDATTRQPPGDGRKLRCDRSHQRVQVYYGILTSVALGGPRPAPENELIPPPLHERKKKREPSPSDPPQPPTLPALRAPPQIRARQGGIPLPDGGRSGTSGRIPPRT